MNRAGDPVATPPTVAADPAGLAARIHELADCSGPSAHRHRRRARRRQIHLRPAVGAGLRTGRCPRRHGRLPPGSGRSRRARPGRGQGSPARPSMPPAIWPCWTDSPDPPPAARSTHPSSGATSRSRSPARSPCRRRRGSSSPRATTCCSTSRPGIGCARCSTETWFLDTEESLRIDRLVDRHTGSAGRRRRPWIARCRVRTAATPSWCWRPDCGQTCCSSPVGRAALRQRGQPTPQAADGDRHGCRPAESGHSQPDAGSAQGAAGLGSIAGPGPAVAEHGAVRDQVVRRRVGDRGGDHVAGPDRPVDGADRGEMHQPAVPGPAAEPSAALVLASLTGGDQHLDLGADQRPVAGQRATRRPPPSTAGTAR